MSLEKQIGCKSTNGNIPPSAVNCCKPKKLSDRERGKRGINDFLCPPECDPEPEGPTLSDKEACGRPGSVVKSVGKNSFLVLSPKGNGFLTADCPNNGVWGGNCRGKRAVDWQRKRSKADRVASGNFSVISGGCNNGALGTYTTVAGGVNNVAGGSGTGAFVGGGADNRAKAFCSSVVGGKNNHVKSNAKHGVVCGGVNNYVYGSESSVLGGKNNQVKSNAKYGVVCGGVNNYVYGSGSSVVGGIGNKIKSNAKYGVVCGGVNNYVYGSESSVVGGTGNKINQDCFGTFIGGGRKNMIDSIGGTLFPQAYSSIVGGIDNTISGGIGTTRNFIGGGSNNMINGDNNIGSSVVGGHLNKIEVTNPQTDSYNFIGGGSENQISGSEINNSSVVGGSNNSVQAKSSVIGGGSNNQVLKLFGIIGGGSNNKIESEYSFIGGGYRNQAFSNKSVIGGGFNNQLFNGSYSGIVGGRYNSILEQTDNSYVHCFIGGGAFNFINGVDIQSSSIVGGSLNTIRARNSVICGGHDNRIIGTHSLIGSGEGNRVELTKKLLFRDGFECGNTDSWSEIIGSPIVNEDAGLCGSIYGLEISVNDTDPKYVVRNFDEAQCVIITFKMDHNMVNLDELSEVTILEGSHDTDMIFRLKLVYHSSQYFLNLVVAGGTTEFETELVDQNVSVSFIWSAIQKKIELYQNSSISIQEQVEIDGLLINKICFGGVNIEGTTSGSLYLDNFELCQCDFSYKSSIVGGCRNEILNNYSIIGGGYQNKIYSKKSVIGGGNQNIVQGYQSFIGGGKSNQIRNLLSVIGGGDQNMVNGKWSLIGGGQQNYIGYGSNNSNICGGRENKVNTSLSVISGGDFNYINQRSSFIGSGLNNRIEKEIINIFEDGFEDGFEDDGVGNWDGQIGSPAVTLTAAMEGDYGLEISIDDQEPKGFFTQLSSSEEELVIKFKLGSYNTLGDEGEITILRGKDTNEKVLFEIVMIPYTISGAAIKVRIHQNDFTVSEYETSSLTIPNEGADIEFKWISNSNRRFFLMYETQSQFASGLDIASQSVKKIEFGGLAYTGSKTGFIYLDAFQLCNFTRAQSVIVGGSNNRVYSSNSFIGGGNLNTTRGNWGVILGGVQNTASGEFGSILGGKLNTASGEFGTVLGGYKNIAAGNYSVAFGQKAHALHDNCLVWGGGSGYITTTAPNTVHIDNIYSTAIAMGLPVRINSNGLLGYEVSSQRFKENVEDLAEKYVSKLDQLRPVKFTYKEDENKMINFGLIAEEVEAVLPELVRYQQGEVVTLEYEQIIPLLISSYQKLQKEVDELKNKVQHLESL